MAKLPFSKLGLKRQNEIRKVKIGNDLEVEVKQYLPVNEKLDLIASVLNNTYDENNFISPIKVEVIGCLEIIKSYTNITFTEKQQEDIGKLYDLLEENGIIDLILDAIPKVEYEGVLEGINETIKSFYTYQSSVLGILENVKQNYSELDFNATEIQQKLADPDNLTLLKDILTKMG